jgi:hypothetical protein
MQHNAFRLYLLKSRYLILETVYSVLTLSQLRMYIFTDDFIHFL